MDKILKEYISCLLQENSSFSQSEVVQVLTDQLQEKGFSLVLSQSGRFLRLVKEYKEVMHTYTIIIFAGLDREYKLYISDVYAQLYNLSYDEIEKFTSNSKITPPQGKLIHNEEIPIPENEQQVSNFFERIDETIAYFEEIINLDDNLNENKKFLNETITDEDETVLWDFLMDNLPKYGWRPMTEDMRHWEKEIHSRASGKRTIVLRKYYFTIGVNPYNLNNPQNIWNLYVELYLPANIPTTNYMWRGERKIDLYNFDTFTGLINHVLFALKDTEKFYEL